MLHWDVYLSHIQLPNYTAYYNNYRIAFVINTFQNLAYRLHAKQNLNICLASLGKGMKDVAMDCLGIHFMMRITSMMRFSSL